MLSVLTINIGAAARERAERLLEWLAARPEDAFILTEASSGEGTAYLLNQFAQAGFTTMHKPDPYGDRGVALISRVPINTATVSTAAVSIPSRFVAATLATEPATTVLGVYVPSRDRSQSKTEKKQRFIASLVEAIGTLPAKARRHTILGGDYNVIARTHQPLHAGFFPFELDFLDSLNELGFIDAHTHRCPQEQPYSWIGRTGDGYRYDYFHVGEALGANIAASTYLHETREQRLTDHAAVALTIDVTVPAYLRTSNPLDAGTMALF